MQSLRLNRKGIIEDWVPLFVSLIIMVLIIIFFVTINAGDKLDEVALEEQKEFEANRFLIDYIRLNGDLLLEKAESSVALRESSSNSAEEFALADAYDKEVFNMLKESSNAYFEKRSNDDKRLEINLFKISLVTFGPDSVKRSRNSGEVTAELPYFNEKIELRLYYE